MRTSILLFSLCFSVSLIAQDYDFGKVSKEELQEKFNPLDSSANATYLFKYRRTYFEYKNGIGFSLTTDIHERIKIYNKEGFDNATCKINLYVDNKDMEIVSSIKGVTYNLENDKIEETKLEKDAIFKSEESKYRNQTKFTMPNIKAGTVIEYKYKITSPFVWNVDDFLFQHAIPIKYLEATFETPEYFNFKPVQRGFLNLNPKSDYKSGQVTFTSTNRPNFNHSVNSSAGTFNSSKLNFIINQSIYNLSNIPALKEEPFVNNIDNYRSSVKYELSFVSFPQSPIKYYSTTWEDVVKTIYKTSSFDAELDKTGYFEKFVDILIANETDPLKRVTLIFDLLKNKIKWDGYYGKFPNNGVKKAFIDNTGNVAEINLILTSMLRYAGLNANPVLVSTRDNGMPLFPTVDGYNYVISAVETDNGIILLDATGKYSAPNVLPFRTLNWEGRIIRKDNSSTTIDLYPKEKSKKQVSMIISLNDKGVIEGGIRTTQTNHLAMSYREDYLETGKSQFLEKLENKLNGIDLDEFQVKNESDLSKPIVESYKFSIENQADIINDKIYFSPLFFLKTKENPFKLDKREFPVDFGYPSNSKYLMNINLPDGYKIESIPSPIVLMLPDNLGSYTYNITTFSNSVQISIETEINQPIISSLHYESLKAYFSKIIETEAEQIVLSKI